MSRQEQHEKKYSIILQRPAELAVAWHRRRPELRCRRGPAHHQVTSGTLHLSMTVYIATNDLCKVHRGGVSRSSFRRLLATMHDRTLVRQHQQVQSILSRQLLHSFLPSPPHTPPPRPFPPFPPYPQISSPWPSSIFIALPAGLTLQAPQNKREWLRRQPWHRRVCPAPPRSASVW